MKNLANLDVYIKSKKKVNFPNSLFPKGWNFNSSGMFVGKLNENSSFFDSSYNIIFTGPSKSLSTVQKRLINFLRANEDVIDFEVLIK
jgi:hypothetical protein